MRRWSKNKQEKKLKGTIKGLNSRVRELEKRENILKRNIKQSINKAKKHNMENDKHGVIYEMKRKEEYQREIKNARGQKMNVEKQIVALQKGGMNLDTMNEMKNATNLLNKMHEKNEVDDVQEVMDDVEQSQAKINEVDGILGKDLHDNLEGNEKYNAEEEDLYNQFLDLEAEEVMRKLPEAKNASSNQHKRLMQLRT